MNAFMLITGSGPMVVLTSHPSPEEPVPLRLLRGKGIEKFIAFPMDLEMVHKRYGMHYEMVKQELSQTDDLRVLDADGDRVFRLFRFDELGRPMAHEAMAA